MSPEHGPIGAARARAAARAAEVARDARTPTMRPGPGVRPTHAQLVEYMATLLDNGTVRQSDVNALQSMRELHDRYPIRGPGD